MKKNIIRLLLGSILIGALAINNLYQQPEELPVLVQSVDSEGNYDGKFTEGYSSVE